VANISIGLPYRQVLIGYKYSSRIEYLKCPKYRTQIKTINLIYITFLHLKSKNFKEQAFQM